MAGKILSASSSRQWPTGGKGDRNGFSLEKGSVIGFEKPDLLGEGRLGQAQHFRRFGQVAGFAQGKQGSEMLQIYH